MTRFVRTGNQKTENFKMPARATGKSAGYDIYNNTGEDIVIAPGQVSKKISTGLKVEMDDFMFLMLHMRSGHGFGFNVRLANTTGIIDADYAGNPKNDGEMFVKFYNPSDNTESLVIPKGEAMAQAIFVRYGLIDGDNYGTGPNRTGGFGSTST